MTNTLITFLGKGNPNSGYDQARYKFEDSQNESGLIINNDRNVSKRAHVFGVALYTHLKNKLNKFIVVGTTGSEWQYIYYDEIIKNFSPREITIFIKLSLTANSSIFNQLRNSNSKRNLKNILTNFDKNSIPETVKADFEKLSDSSI